MEMLHIKHRWYAQLGCDCPSWRSIPAFQKFWIYLENMTIILSYCNMVMVRPWGPYSIDKGGPCRSVSLQNTVGSFVNCSPCFLGSSPPRRMALSVLRRLW